MDARTPATPDLSVVIPSYNSAEWLPSTITALTQALERTQLRAELIVVDDGSSDDTSDVMRELATAVDYEVRVVSQENEGVFLAVWHGVRAARATSVLILNSRLLLDPTALRHLEEAEAFDGRLSWNGHVDTDAAAPLVGRFWEVPTYVFWGDYLADPKATDITPDNFDRIPKGTGCFLVGRDLMLEAYEACWPEQGSRFTSDDTKLLRYISSRQTIRIDPGFAATYRPRTTVAGFLKHAANRGTLFVDSYAGTSVGRNAALVTLAAAPPLVLIAAIGLLVTGQWLAVAILAVLAVLAIALPAAIAGARGAPPRSILSYFLFILPFGVVFWRGLVRGLIVHRRSFGLRDDDRPVRPSSRG